MNEQHEIEQEVLALLTPEQVRAWLVGLPAGALFTPKKCTGSVLSEYLDGQGYGPSYVSVAPGGGWADIEDGDLRVALPAWAALYEQACMDAAGPGYHSAFLTLNQALTLLPETAPAQQTGELSSAVIAEAEAASADLSAIAAHISAARENVAPRSATERHLDQALAGLAALGGLALQEGQSDG